MPVVERVCFDIACNAFHRFDAPWLDTFDDALQYYGDRYSGSPITFHAATAILESTGEILSFTHPKQLSECLSGADELITFNGSTYDLPILSLVLGMDRMQEVLSKPHHDVQRLQRRPALRDAARDWMDVSDSAWEQPTVSRREQLEAHPEYNSFQRSHLSQTYRDAFFTLTLFRCLEGSVTPHG